MSIRAAASIALGSPLPVTDAAGAVVAAVEKPVSTFRSIATTLGNVVLSPLFSTRSGAGGIGAAKTAGSRSDRCGGSSLRRDLDAAAPLTHRARRFCFSLPSIRLLTFPVL